MKNKNNLLIVFLTALVIVSFFLHFFDKGESKKIAYVRSQELVYGYLGMKEAQEQFRLKTQLMQANLDTLKNDYNVTLNNYKINTETYTPEEKKEMIGILEKQRNNIVQYSKAIEEKTKEEEGKMLEGILNQINSYVEEYGIRNGYEIIFGTTLSGSILYGNEATDITDELLTDLNNVYKGE
ncbi:MAG: hypothetical protein A2W91_12985 [Bacteroidetes bacterium GWF2_38_335]|nr:MAG: hypothetical protein A2W91_12985 [Bacteroidetes bacterium GWF2_38_335]HBS86939.1 hypothetical protein [Bacteroidales bacterium]